MQILDRHKYDPPFAERELVETVQGITSALPNQNYRDLLKELLDQGLEQAVQRLKQYAEFQPDRFRREEVNSRLDRFLPYGRTRR